MIKKQHTIIFLVADDNDVPENEDFSEEEKYNSPQSYSSENLMKNYPYIIKKYIDPNSQNDNLYVIGKWRVPSATYQSHRP